MGLLTDDGSLHQAPSVRELKSKWEGDYTGEGRRRVLLKTKSDRKDEADNGRVCCVLSGCWGLRRWECGRDKACKPRDSRKMSRHESLGATGGM